MRAIFWRDMRLAIGAGGGFGQGLGFFLLVVFLVGVALGPVAQTFAQILPAIVFVAVLLAGLLSLDRLFRHDFDDGTLTQLRLGPVPLSLVVAIKCLVHWFTTALAMIVLVPIIGLGIGVSPAEIGRLIIALCIGTPALSFIGAIGAALTLSIKRASLIQALVTLPLYLPTLIYGTLGAAGGSRQNAALALSAGLSLFSLVLGPWIAAKTIERHG